MLQAGHQIHFIPQIRIEVTKSVQQRRSNDMNNHTYPDDGFIAQKNSQAREIIESTICSLMEIGCTHTAALMLLAVQASIRIRGEELEELKRFIANLTV